MSGLTPAEAAAAALGFCRGDLVRAFALFSVAIGSAVALAMGACGVCALFRSRRAAGASILSSLFFAGWAVCVGAGSNDGNKPPPIPTATLVFDAYLRDAGSVATNDHPVIRWSYAPVVAADVVHIDARPKGSAEPGDWMRYHSGPVTDGVWSGHMPGCTGMVVHVWCEYVPPPSVTTNGVYHLHHLSPPLDYIPLTDDLRKWVLLRTPVCDGPRRMSPPELTAPPDAHGPLAVEIPQDLVDDFLNAQETDDDEP